jgi:HAD superfamily hydrolase (TIGR01509 family)
MIKVLLFDLDGVLFDGREFHREQFMNTVNEFLPGAITNKYHDTYLDGLSTRQKIQHLVKEGFLSEELSTKLFQRKQELTEQSLDEHLSYSKKLVGIFTSLSESYTIGCVSNSIRSTIEKCLKGMGIFEFFKLIISNEDCKEPKPAPEPYLLAFQRLGVNPYECAIFEDSSYGRTSAFKSGGHLIPIVDTTDLTLQKILTSIQKIHQRRINVVIPMAGLGSRFSKAGYTVPKPFIPVFGKPMIHWVIENMQIKAEEFRSSIDPVIQLRFHFIVQQKHLDEFNFVESLNTLGIDYTITPIQTVTEGAACTVLLVKDKIYTSEPLVIVNSDQYLEWNPNEFYRALLNPSYDGCISVFENRDPTDIKWSYSKVDEDGIVQDVAEKKYISQWATTGIYGWSYGYDFVNYATQMILKNVRVNNEFYVCPVYNEAIQSSSMKFRNLLCKKLWGLGVPEDLDLFLKTYQDTQT